MMDVDDFWVFGYGSLMWRPGFDFREAVEARLFGFHRALCVRSHVHRGTPQRPGLVLGLDFGGSCRGMAFRVAGDAHAAVMAYLRARELVTHVYEERILPVALKSGERVPAVAYVVDRRHLQYAGGLSAEDAVAAVRGASGQSGSNVDYVLNTLDQLRTMKIRDGRLERVAAALKRVPAEMRATA